MDIVISGYSVKHALTCQYRNNPALGRVLKQSTEIYYLAEQARGSKFAFSGFNRAIQGLGLDPNR